MITVLLITVNVAISLASLSAIRKRANPERYLFIPAQVATGKNLTGMVLSHFSHVDFGHLFFNMLTLYFFAPVVEQLLGKLSLLVIYVLSGMIGTLLTFLVHRTDPRYRALGASGSVTGVIFAAIVLYPRMDLYFYFVPVPIPAPIFAVGYVALSLYFAGRRVGNVGHEAHIGGACTGFALGGFLSPLGFGPLLARAREFLR